ncbi:hypothetical protein [Paracoccus sp. SSK6]|uniref:hypothetical protein n=1 Tax=Paracoccus sp. SSK6 TaxID=3143131 RepID=UPI00321A4A50
MKQHWNTNRPAHPAQPTGQNTGQTLEDDLAAMGFPMGSEDAGPATSDAVLDQFPDPDHPGLARLDGRASRQAVPPVNQIAPDDMQAALAALVQLLCTVPVVADVAPPASQPRRTVRAHPRQIENTLRLIQQCGLTPSAVALRPDGSTVIEIGNPPAPEKRKPKGWDI